MSQPLLRAVSSPPNPPVDESIDEAVEGLGPSLRALRKAHGYSLADASTRLKYTVRQLEALENEDWAKLPQGMLLRGLVKNYGRYLAADVEGLLVMLDNQAGTCSVAKMLAQHDALNGVDLPLHVEGGSRSWGWLLIIVLLVVAAGIYAVNRGWVPDAWLIFDWLKALKP